MGLSKHTGLSRPHRVLIVTDRYPPETMGGAELSLHDALKSLDPEDWDCRVLAFSHCWPSAGLSGHVFEGIRVNLIPVQSWISSLAELEAKTSKVRGFRRRILSVILQVKILARYILRSRRRVWVRVNHVVLLILARLVGRGEDYSASPEEVISLSNARVILQAAVRDWQPDIIHCDNKDSIVSFADVNRGQARMVAMVRDNRFFCAHSRQKTTIGESVCQSCSFGCVSDAIWPLGPMLRSEMQKAAGLRQSALSKADRIMTTSQFLADQIKSLGPPAVVVSNPHPSVESFESAAGRLCQAATTEILFAGHLRREKGPLLLLECLTRLSKELQDFQIVFAGRGPLESAIEEGARRAGMARRVRLVGFLDRPSLFRQLARSSVVVAPALWPEPFGRLPLEAGIARRPIVASALGGYLETVRDGETGFLIPPGDRDAFADAIIRLALDPPLANRMGLAAREHVVKHFAPSTVANRISAVWQDVLQTS